MHCFVAKKNRTETLCTYLMKYLNITGVKSAQLCRPIMQILSLWSLAESSVLFPEQLEGSLEIFDRYEVVCESGKKLSLEALSGKREISTRSLSNAVKDSSLLLMVNVLDSSNGLGCVNFRDS